MKYLLALTFTFLLLQFASAQSEGKITYNETIKLDIQFEGMDEAMKAMLPESQSFKKELLFKGKESIFQMMKGEGPENLDMASDDGSFRIKMVSDDTEDILYLNSKEKKKVHQRGMMGKSFVVSDDMTKLKWKITAEKVKYLGYECQKAVIEEEDNFVIAWFSSQIPVQVGPDMYHGLPGAILMVSVNDGEREFKALDVNLEPLEKNAISLPKNGKKVNEAEYEKIRIEKEKETEEMYGGKGKRIRH